MQFRHSPIASRMFETAHTLCPLFVRSRVGMLRNCLFGIAFKRANPFIEGDIAGA